MISRCSLKKIEELRRAEPGLAQDRPPVPRACVPPPPAATPPPPRPPGARPCPCLQAPARLLAGPAPDARATITPLGGRRPQTGLVGRPGPPRRERTTVRRTPPGTIEPVATAQPCPVDGCTG